MQATSSNKTMVSLLSAVILMVLLYTGISKLLDQEKFNYAIQQSDLLAPYSALLSWLVPVLEIVIAALLFIPGLRLTGLISSLMLLTIFTVYLVYVVSANNNLPCACGGMIESLGWKAHIIVNLFLIVMNAAGIILVRKQRNVTNTRRLAET